MSLSFRFLLLLLPISLFSLDENRDYSSYNDFRNNPHLQKGEFQEVLPHILPYQSPLRPILDSIFTREERVTLNRESLKKAGFTIQFDQPRSYIIVASHPLLPGYLVKLHLDSELRLKRNLPGWKWFVQRVQSAKMIANIIKEKNIQHFVVPQKWIYPLPFSRSLKKEKGHQIKNEILIVEDMNLHSKRESEKAWKKVMTPSHLRELALILEHAGGSGYRPENIVYTKSNKFAFIDTEYYKKVSNYGSIKKYFHPSLKKKWIKSLKAKK